jgi:hypothetical protein
MRGIEQQNLSKDRENTITLKPYQNPAIKGVLIWQVKITYKNHTTTGRSFTQIKRTASTQKLRSTGQTVNGAP